MFSLWKLQSEVYRNGRACATASPLQAVDKMKQKSWKEGEGEDDDQAIAFSRE